MGFNTDSREIEFGQTGMSLPGEVSVVVETGRTHSLVQSLATAHTSYHNIDRFVVTGSLPSDQLLHPHPDCSPAQRLQSFIGQPCGPCPSKRHGTDVLRQRSWLTDREQPEPQLSRCRGHYTR